MVESADAKRCCFLPCRAPRTGGCRAALSGQSRTDHAEEHCIHAISYIARGLRLRVASPGWGEVASFAVLQRLRPWIVDRRQTHAWVGTALGLDAYPLIYRDWHRPVSGAILGPVYRLLGGERGQQATFGPPAPLDACAGPAEK